MDWTEQWRAAQTDRDRANVVFAFRQKVLKDKSLEDLRKTLGVPPATNDVVASIDGRCVLK